MFQFGAGSEWLLAFLRTNVLPSVAKYILSLDVVKNFVFPLISQIGINYRHSSLSGHAGDEYFKVKAGDRMPYLLIDGRSLYDKLREPKFHLIVFSDAARDLPALQTELERRYGGLVDFNVVPLNPQVAAVFGTDKPFNVLLRPDNYIGFISPEISLHGLSIYLDKFIGHLSSIRE